MDGQILSSEVHEPKKGNGTFAFLLFALLVIGVIGIFGILFFSKIIQTPKIESDAQKIILPSPQITEKLEPTQDPSQLGTSIAPNPSITTTPTNQATPTTKPTLQLERMNTQNLKLIISTPTPTPTPKADLAIDSFAIKPTPAKNQLLTIEFRVFNQGQATTGTFTWEWWADSTTKACSGEYKNLQPGYGQMTLCNYTYTGSTNTTSKVIVDSKNAVSESNETNNTYTYPIKIF